MRSLVVMPIITLVLNASLQGGDRIDLRVLYAGNPGSERMAEFEAFLKQHFTRVALTDTSRFQEDEADDYDVVIFDWTRTFNDKGAIVREQRIQDPPRLSRDFDRPAVLIGETGGRITANLKLKLNWLCLCLYDSAHHLALDHEVFHKPLSVEPVLEEIPTPEEYPYLTLDELGPTMEVWRVQTKNYPLADPGLVHTLYGFEDSPDAEVFARGNCMKGPDSVAISRQGNYFHWGFSVSPSDMTPAAQRLFVNAICYIRKFDGERPLVQSIEQPREWALRYAMFPKFLSPEYREIETRMLRNQIASAPEMLPERFKNDVEAYIEEHEKAHRASMETFLPQQLREQFGMDANAYEAYYRKNYEYLRPDGYQFVVDEDVAILGVSNRDPRLLDLCVDMLAEPDRAAIALRILKRYTTEEFETIEQWKTWLTENRDRLFFTDCGGYRFVQAPIHNSADE